jgi:hypothetical protein
LPRPTARTDAPEGDCGGYKLVCGLGLFELLKGQLPGRVDADFLHLPC